MNTPGAIVIGGAACVIAYAAYREVQNPQRRRGGHTAIWVDHHHNRRDADDPDIDRDSDSSGDSDGDSSGDSGGDRGGD